ncbi:hypothetical protein Pst134EB_016858 [Puccinia striiformis f. sp. tritici]|nr:hypothetical protein Pst134EB_016858 [Puccinia striiformis f. sp. tritici]
MNAGLGRTANSKVSSQLGVFINRAARLGLAHGHPGIAPSLPSARKIAKMNKRPEEDRKKNLHPGRKDSGFGSIYTPRRSAGVRCLLAGAEAVAEGRARRFARWLTPAVVGGYSRTKDEGAGGVI